MSLNLLNCKKWTREQKRLRYLTAVYRRLLKKKKARRIDYEKLENIKEIDRRKERRV